MRGALRTAEYVCGTEDCYVNKPCRCDDCRTAATRARKIRQHVTRCGEEPLTVDAIGPRRRLQALMTQGWSLPRLAALAGVSEGCFQKIHRPTVYQRVGKGTAGLISQLYDELWNQEPPGMTPLERHSVSYSKAIARRHGYAPPMAWAGIDIDDPEAEARIDADEVVGPDWVAIERAMSGREVELSVKERRIAVAACQRRGLSITETAQLLNLAPKNVSKHRRKWEEAA